MKGFGSTILLVLSVVGLASGLAAGALGHGWIAERAWAATAFLVLVWLVIQVAGRLLHRSFSVDVIAVLAIAGALATAQYLAGAVIAVMFATGDGLEAYAQARARRELSALLNRAPRTARRLEGDSLVEVPLAMVRPGDRLLVRSGDIVPADGIISNGTAVLDESALTGESVPLTRRRGDRVASGAVNAGDPFEVTVLAAAADSTYAAIVQLVRTAQEEKAPFVRLADRYALWFVPFTLGLAGIAYAISGDPVRALAVLVVATPCPLILAAPVAIISGISRAARRGLLIKTGGALETLARARTLLMDKTGTLTGGRARLVGIEAGPQADAGELLRLAASLDQVSHHVMASTLVDAARERNLPLQMPTAVSEQPGAGISGTVNGRQVLVGGFVWVSAHVPEAPWARRALRRMTHEGVAGIFVAVDGSLAGAVLAADEIRPETPAALRALRQAGIRKIIMVSGDHQEVAESIAAVLGLDAILAERTPQDKVTAVLAERAEAVTIMVGDGINDAPALAAADIGIALGAQGGGAASEAADAVLLVDRLDRLADGLRTARRTRAIALQSVLVGMALSIIAMAFATAGLLAPVAGAVLQEVIDVIAIANALRALGPFATARARTLPAAKATALRAEHRGLMAMVERIETVADRLDTLSPDAARREITEVDGLLRDYLVPHERSDDAALYPELARMLGGRDPLGSLSRSHREILHLARLYGRMAADVGPAGPDADQIREICRLLYGLSAILKLHFAEEDEVFHTLS